MHGLWECEQALLSEEFVWPLVPVQSKAGEAMIEQTRIGGAPVEQRIFQGMYGSVIERFRSMAVRAWWCLRRQGAEYLLCSFSAVGRYGLLSLGEFSKYNFEAGTGMAGELDVRSP